MVIVKSVNKGHQTFWYLASFQSQDQILDMSQEPCQFYHYRLFHAACIIVKVTRSSATAEKQRVSCPHGGGEGLGPPAHSPSAHSGYTYAYGQILNPQQEYVKRAVHQAHFQMNRALKVIQGHPHWCRQESSTVCCRNVQLMPTLFPKLGKIWQRENGKFVDFNDPTQVWRRHNKKRLRISTNDLYCQKLELLPYISVADSMGLHSLVFDVITLQSRTLSI